MSLAPPEHRANAPAVEPWPQFHDSFAGQWRQGEHCLFVGPTGSGKTVAARTLTDDRQFVVVLGTKVRDREMDAYIEEGYTRVETWPPPRDAVRPLADGSVRIVLWPKIQNREQLRSRRDVFARCLDSVLIDGGWTVVIDEALWLAERTGLNLGHHLSAVAYTGRSSGVTLMVLVQRPSGMPRTIWANCSHAFLWHLGVTDDVRELASLGTENPKVVSLAVQHLRGHSFLYLPCRADRQWAVSEVQL